MRWFLVASALLLVAGVGLIALSIAEGGASLALVLFIPVVAGSSGAFLLGVLLLFVGFLSLPFGLADQAEETDEEEEVPALPAGGPSGPRPERGFGGFVLVGPVPIVFGSWKGISSRLRWALAVVGALILTGIVVVLVWYLR